jgi:aminoglycoside phosphotransferase family enzyme/predicted kinase
MTAVSVNAAAHSPDARGDGYAPIVRETHTGVVVLVGDRAFKAKKPISTDFLDFTDVHARERACAEEVRLNSRLAPDSYLGVAHLQWAWPNEAAEPVVVMRRYPDDRRLATLVARAEPVDGVLRVIAGILARFHEDGARSSAVDADARVPMLTARWDENLTALWCHADTLLSPDVLAEIDRLAHRYLDGRQVLFADRISDRRIVDGHGDLIADDIFSMPEGPVLLDCLEFDDHLRHVDGLDDAAFLAMDLEYLGRRDLADLFLGAYLHEASDPAPMSLAHFFIAYRAVVRAKVDCIRAGQGDPDAGSRAERHLGLALDHLRAGAVRLVLVGGNPGTGKTTLARELAARIDATVVSTDDVRRRLVARGAVGGEPGDLDAGRYRADNVAAVYSEALRMAALLLVGGHTVILDATWRNPVERQRAREVAAQHGCPTVELECVLDVDSALARIRSRGDDTASEITPELARSLHADPSPWAEARRIDTGRPLGDSVSEAQQLCCLAI